MSHISSIINDNGGTDRSSISSLEGKLGIKLPNDYREFLLAHDGGNIVDNTIDLESCDVELQIRSLHSMKGDENVLFSDLYNVQSCYEDSVPEGYFVIGDDYGGNRFIMEHSSSRVYWWDHEDDQLVNVAENFSDLIDRIIPVPEEPLSDVEELAVNGKSLDDIDRYVNEFGVSSKVAEESARHGNVELFKLILDRSYPLGDAMRFAAVNGEVGVIDLIVSSGVSINSILSDGRTALDWTTWKPEYADLLIQRGAKLAEELT